MNKLIVKPIPPFKSLEEEAHFWNTHESTNLSEIPDQELHPAILIEKQRRLEDIVAIRFKARDLEKLKNQQNKRSSG